jgi:hypothetical protein
MRTAPILPPTHSPGRYRDLDARMKSRLPSDYYSGMPNGWFVYEGPRLVTVVSAQIGSDHQIAELVDHATLLTRLHDRMTDLDKRLSMLKAGPEQWALSVEYTIMSTAWDLIESDLLTGTSLATWAAPRQLVDHALTLAMLGEHSYRFIFTEWQEF